MAQDEDVISHIDGLITEEHQLRERRQRGEIDKDDELERLRAVETELDRCWDLLRQRRALRDAGDDPDQARARPADQVEGYLG